jgi:hypothetical protein
MTLLSPSNLSFENAGKWVKNHKFALLVSWVLAVWWWNMLTWYRWFYDIESTDFRKLTLEYVNEILKKQKLAGPWECIYSENRLWIGVLFCELKNGKDFWPKSYELKWLNKSSYVCTRLRLETDWIINTKSGMCYRWRMTLLGVPEYYDRSGNKIDPMFIPWNIYIVPNQANQW